MKPNILIVEDCPVMRLIIKKAITLTGIEVGEIFEANDGVEGLRILDSKRIDLMIVDINMPVMNGLEMLEIVRTDPETSKIPVLTVSTESNKKRIKFIVQLSSGFVHKPFTPEILKDKILKLFRNHSITNQEWHYLKNGNGHADKPL